MARYSRGEIAKNILLTLVAAGALASIIVLPGMAAILALFKPKNKKEYFSLRRSLYSMRGNRLIEMKKERKGYSLSITNKGRSCLPRYNFENLLLKKQKQWDGFWRLVTFDIPETKRGARTALNIKLKELGFYHFQKSIFLYPYNCKEEIDFIKDYFNSREHIKYFLVKDFEGNKKLKRYFGL